MNDQKSTQTLSISYDIFPSQEGLLADEKELVMKARDAMKTAYSPYSHFSVGAAIQLKDGSIVEGSNQENAAYGPTNCAERSAIFAVGSLGKKDQIQKIAVIARPTESLDQPVSLEQEQNGTPCGICRQVLKEYETLSSQKIIILCVFNTDRIFRFEGIDTLLPFGFGPSVLQ